MPKRYLNYDGVTEPKFSLGIADGKVDLESKDGRLHVSIPIQIDMPEGITFVPTNATDLVTLEYITERLNQNFLDSKNYVNGIIKDLFEGGVTPNPDEEEPDPKNPETPTPSGDLFSLVMLPPVTVDALVEAPTSLGVVTRTKFIERIIFELKEQFVSPTGNDFMMAVGTKDEPNKFVDWFNVTDLDHTLVAEVLQTIDLDTELFLHISEVLKEEEPEFPELDYDFIFYNDRDRVVDSYRKDASGRVITVTVHSDDCGSEDVIRLDTFGADILGKGYLDFAINLPVVPNHRYRIVQQNPALAEYPDDPSILKTDVGWMKDKEYVFEDSGEEELYAFLLGRSTGKSDYAHIWIYDLEDDTTDTAMFSYHIKNELEMPDGNISLMALIDEITTEVSVLGQEEIVIEQKSMDPIAQYVMMGEMHNHAREFTSNLKPADMPCTEMTVRVDGLRPKSQWSFALINPILDHFAAHDWVLRDDLGRRYVSGDIEVGDDGSIVMAFPVGTDKDYDISLALVSHTDPDDTIVCNIENRITFLETPLEYVNSNPDAGIMPLVDAENGMTYQGKMLIRILTF